MGISEAKFWAKGSTRDAAIGDPSSTSAAARAQAALNQLRVDREEGRVVPREPVSAVEIVRESQQPASPWSHDPDALVGQPIEELRRLIREVDATIEADHLDEVELIAILSADYVPPS